MLFKNLHYFKNPFKLILKPPRQKNISLGIFFKDVITIYENSPVLWVINITFRIRKCNSERQAQKQHNSQIWQF